MNGMSLALRFSALLAAAMLVFGADPPREWPVYGGNSEGLRHSPLKQINRANVAQLAVAWTYDAQDGPGGLQTSPIVVNGVLYANTPKSRAIALDAATGKLLWKFDPGIDLRGANRGLTYWSGGTRTPHLRRRRQVSSTPWTRAPASPSRASAPTAASTCARAWAATRPNNRWCSLPPASSTRTC